MVNTDKGAHTLVYHVKRPAVTVEKTMTERWKKAGNKTLEARTEASLFFKLFHLSLLVYGTAALAAAAAAVIWELVLVPWLSLQPLCVLGCPDDVRMTPFYLSFKYTST